MMPESGPYLGVSIVERVTGIEPALSAWEADVLPLNYTRAPARLPWHGSLRRTCEDIVPDVG
jgi:hypothetical protein